MLRFIVCTAILSVATVNAAEPRRKFTIHEWGTFTVLQDANGKTLSGVNVNEEPLPAFVHRLYPGVVKSGHSHLPTFDPRSKGLPAQFASATMRMETPVIYIYPPDNKPQSIDVSVRFNGGWISEWYPNADVNAPGFDKNRHDLGRLTADTIGSVAWNNVTINSNAEIPSTSQHVWNAPREVATPVLESTKGEAENYLFYRGVANIQAPLRVVQDAKTGTCRILRNTESTSSSATGFHHLWLVDIAENGHVAYQSVEVKNDQQTEDTLASCRFVFPKDQYRKEDLAKLKAEMHAALVEEGLYKDEATAMLKTWQLSYFQSAGTRLFFTLPRDWTDRVLPMEVSRYADISRVMIGRIEMLNDRQRSLLQFINKERTANPEWYYSNYEKFDKNKINDELARVMRGEMEASSLSIKVPEDYVAYLRLGRFRDSIVSNAAYEDGNENLRYFLSAYRLYQR